MRRVIAAMRAVARAEARAEEARAELYAAVRAAHDAGEPPSLLASVLGVSRQRVSQILKKEE
jgi:hypothetical protein